MPGKTLAFFILFCLFAASPVIAQHHNTYLAKADSLYEAGQSQTAKTFYQKAAEQGNAKAHFALAYRYILSRKNRLFHYVQAAKKGHAKALDYALELLLFRSASLTKTDPQRALNLYRQAKKANPNLEIYDETEKVKVMKMSVGTAGFDGNTFIQKNDVDTTDLTQIFAIWQLAEKASRPGANFGIPDPQVVLALVVRGWLAPSSKMAAIESVYEDYKKGVVKPFYICEFADSGAGITFCANRVAKIAEKKRQVQLDSLKQIAD